MSGRLRRTLSAGLRPLRRYWANRKLDRILAPRRSRPRPARHALPGELILSLTSHPPRFADLDRTVSSLLQQSLVPDRLILWIASDAVDHLPGAVRRLARDRIEVRPVPDWGPYKKLVVALAEFPEAFIVTADDDVWYEPKWLETLAGGYDPGSRCILCRRAHRLRAGAEVLAPYDEWEKDVQDERAALPSTDLVPTGVGGILYPPGTLHPDAVDEKLFMSLSPTADDLWFYWMARRAGSTHRRVGGPFDLLFWPFSQGSNLARLNVEGGGNDRQARALAEAYGLPHLLPVRAGA